MLPQLISFRLNKPDRLLLTNSALVRSLQLSMRSLRRASLALSSMLLVCISCLAAACAPQIMRDPGSAWEYTDLRILSPHDEQSSGGDFIAGYARVAGSDFQVRLDLLELGESPQTDFYILLDFSPGGSQELPIDGTVELQWDLLLYLPTLGIPQAFSPPAQGTSLADVAPGFGLPARNDLVPRISRIPWQDYILVSINRAALPRRSTGIKIQAFSTIPGSMQILDSIGPYSANGLPPEEANLLLTFWNSFPAYSPAQSLRKWDGAHTGPYGERHGLAVLLENVRRYTVPVVLLDLRSPASLSALDYLDSLPLVSRLHADKLLILPEAIPGSPAFPLFPDGLPDWTPDYYLEFASVITSRFDIPPSPFLYTPRQLTEFDSSFSLYFSPRPIAAIRGQHIGIPPQVALEPQAGPDGLSLAIRKMLLDNAIRREADPTSFPILVLGGDFQESAFGDPGSANAALSYIANHPWIKPLNSDDLQRIPPAADLQYLPGSTNTSSTELFSPSGVLTNLPEPGEQAGNLLRAEAWHSALSLYNPLPPEPASLAQLRSNYAGGPGILLAAASWAENPASREDCRSDLDLDGIPECILATQNQFAVIDPFGARLVAYFYKNDSGVHQLIAPTSQFVVGLSDPSTWHLEAGDGADPAGIHGAFADYDPPWQLYLFNAQESEFTFASPDLRVVKTFTMQDSGLLVAYQSSSLIQGQIPVALDPWFRFTPGWRRGYQISLLQDGFQVNLADEISLQVSSDLPLEALAFTDSVEKLAVPEDPNFDYPPGHYLPFPLTSIEFQGQGDFLIELIPSEHNINSQD